jgi:Spy/CpxP family protein refolding chaperone
MALAMAVGTAAAACDKGAGPSSTPSAEAQASASAATSASAVPSASDTVSDAASSVEAEDAEAAQAAEDELADELQSHHRHHHAGFAGFVLSSVETLGIAPDQQVAVDAIRKDYRVAMKPLHEANRAVLQLLADGIAAGAIDKPKVDAAIVHAGTAASGVQGVTQNLLNQLHGALHPEQRAALVDKIDAHWAVWREANAGEHAKDDSKPDRHVARIAKELALTSDQVDKFRANLDAAKDAKKPFVAAAFEAYMKAFDAAFVADTFDAKKLPSFESSRIVSWGTERMGGFYEALAPVLTPDQRAKLAEKLRQRASGPGPREKP